MLALLTCCLVFAVGEQSISRLAVIRRAPDFTLLDQKEKTVNLADLKGKVLLVSFVFTTCNGSCPATTHRMGAVQQELKHRGLWNNEQVRFVSITLDPERDTPEAFRQYAKRYDIDPNGWSLLTGTPNSVAPVIADWGMWVKAAANGQLDHPSRIFLVDRGLRIREIYNTELLTVNNVCEDIALLMR